MTTKETPRNTTSWPTLLPATPIPARVTPLPRVPASLIVIWLMAIAAVIAGVTLLGHNEPVGIIPLSYGALCALAALIVQAIRAQ